MSLSELSTQPGIMESIQFTCEYIEDPLAAYRALCEERPNTLLLESAEVESKNDINSLILVDAAVRFVCQGHGVTCYALTPNGEHVLSLLSEKLSSFVKQTSEEDKDPKYINQLSLSFPAPDPNLDEDSKLKQPSVFDVLRTVQTQIKPLREHPYAVFVAGTFAYDIFSTFEPLPDVPTGDNNCPDYVFYLAETLIHIDHQKHVAEVLGSVFSGEDVANQYLSISQRLQGLAQKMADAELSWSTYDHVSEADLKVSKSDEEYRGDVLKLKENILAGDIFQVVPSRIFTLPCPSHLKSYAQLRINNPSPYMFHIQDENFAIFGASPECAVKYTHQTNEMEVYPIAGTLPRGKRPDGSLDRDLDTRIELTLREDTKEKSEHIMLVDLARNDIARVSQPGTRYVKDLLKVDRYSHVMHLVSKVVGELRTDLDSLHAYQACMNMGTLVGAPKVRAAQLIRDVEGIRRGSYGGAVGYITGKGDMNTCIVIRSAFVVDNVAHVQAGAGVVYDSEPQSEADETRNKAQAVITAIIDAHQNTAKSEA